MRNLQPAVFAGALALVLCLGAAGSASAKVDARLEGLAPEEREWLASVEPLMSAEEREAFLDLPEGYQRAAFIRRFWESRDADPATPYNEFRGRYEARLEEARARYRDFADARAVVYVLHGEPADLVETDCGLITWPLELWTFGYSEILGRGFTVIFYQPAAGGPFRIWRPVEGRGVLQAAYTSQPFEAVMLEECAELTDVVEAILVRVAEVEREGPFGVVQADRPPPPADPEWLQTFHAYSTEAPERYEPLTAALDLRFTGRHQSRTVLEGALRVETGAAVAAVVASRRSFAFALTGEVLRDGELFDSFRYRFDLPEPPPGIELLLVFERALRPGAYQLALRLEDLNGGRLFLDRREVEVPPFEAALAATEGPGEEAAAPDEAVAGGPVAGGAVSLRLQGGSATMTSGLVRFEASVEGEGVHKVSFFLDERPVMTKTRPPYGVELDLGSLPRTHTVRAVALDAGGRELATDQVLLNAGEHAFRVRLVDPRNGQSVAGRVRARAEVDVPPASRLERVEFFVNEQPVATVYQPPFLQSVELPSGNGVTLVRAVAHLADGSTAEDVVLLNTPGYTENVEVRLVEVFAAAVDAAGRPLTDLEPQEVRVLEDGVEQELLRFERLDEAPVHVALLVDTSASMAESLEHVRAAALRFFEDHLQPRDRAAVLTFDDVPRLAVGFTGDVVDLASGLAGLRAERGTALFDSLLFALYSFKGLRGQRALLVLSDGEDRRSTHTFDEALDFARASGVTIYTLSFQASGAAKAQLTRLAEETGGRAFAPKSAADLLPIYQEIERDLRSRYLLAYQPASAGGARYRRVDIEVRRAGVQVRALRGYLP